MIILLKESCKEMLENWYIHVFIWLVVFDIITGFCKAFFIKKDSESNKGLLGLVKHLLVTILVLVAYPYLSVVGLKSLAIVFVVFYIVMYLISIIENFGQLGLPVPQFLKDRVYKLKDTIDKGEYKNDKN